MHSPSDVDYFLNCCFLQKVVECLHYLAFHQEQDLHEEALWVTYVWSVCLNMLHCFREGVNCAMRGAE